MAPNSSLSVNQREAKLTRMWLVLSQRASVWVPPEVDPEAKTQIQEMLFIYHGINVKMEI